MDEVSDCHPARARAHGKGCTKIVPALWIEDGHGLVEVQLVDEVSDCHPARARAHGKEAPKSYLRCEMSVSSCGRHLYAASSPTREWCRA